MALSDAGIQAYGLVIGSNAVSSRLDTDYNSLLILSDRRLSLLWTTSNKFSAILRIKKQEWPMEV